MKNKMTREERRAMKKSRKWFKKKRFMIPIGILIFFIGVIMMAPETEETNISYDIISKEDVSTGISTRYNLEVVVKGKASKEELKKLSKEIVEEFKKGGKFNAIIIGLYDHEESIGYGYTLGKVVYAPKGDWKNAADVKAGNYKTMDYTFELKEKEWDKQLTEEEIKVYKTWQNLYQEKDTPEEMADEDEVTKEVAKELNITPEEIKNIMTKHMLWAMSDTKDN